MKSDNPQQIYTPNKLVYVLLLIGSVLFMLFFLFVARQEPLIGYGFAALGFTCSAVLLTSILPGSMYLKITEQGLEYSALFRRHSVLWRDIEEFGLMQLGKWPAKNAMVCFNYVQAYEKSKGYRKFSRAVSGWDEGLNANYGPSSKELVALLNRRLEEYREDHPNP